MQTENQMSAEIPYLSATISPDATREDLIAYYSLAGFGTSTIRRFLCG